MALAHAKVLDPSIFIAHEPHTPSRQERRKVKAGRLMLEALAELEKKGESFAFETTLSGVTYARRIPRWRAAGYHVTLYFLALPLVELGIARVAERVRQGGHHVPDSVVRRRFVSGRRNFDRIYRDLVDAWALYDNSGAEPVLMDWKEKP